MENKLKIFLKLVDLIKGLYNKFKKIDIKYNFQNYIDLYGKYSDSEIDYSYGHCRLNIELSNRSTENRLLNINDFVYRVSNFQKYNYSHFILDYIIYEDINHKENNFGEISANNFTLFAFNNGNEDNAKKNLSINIYADNDTFIENHETLITLNSGEVKKVFNIKLNTESLKRIFISNNYLYLKIVMSIDDFEKAVAIKFVEGRFIYNNGGRGSQYIRDKERNIFDIIIRNNTGYINLDTIPKSIEYNNMEYIKLNIFSSTSSMFDFQLLFRNKVILSEKIKIKVPIYNFILDKTVIYERYWISDFMIKNNIDNYNLKDNCDNLVQFPKYNMEDYFENKL